jgi:hypothetical protein
MYETTNYLKNDVVVIEAIYEQALVNEYGSAYGVVYHVVGEAEAAERVVGDLALGNQPYPYGRDVWSQIRYEVHPPGTAPEEGWEDARV